MDSSTPASRPSTGKKIWRWVRNGLLSLLGLAVLLGMGGAVYELIGEHRDAQRFPQRGKTIQTGRVALNMDCTGTGSPTVILDSGLGVPANGWILVQPEVAKFTRVCSYDRAGYGWSGESSGPRTSDQVAKELRDLLTVSGEKGPFILVGHSFGGYNVRVFTDMYPADVAGLVLVDASHEDQESRLPPGLKAFSDKNTQELKKQEWLGPLLIHLGIMRLTAKADVAGKLNKDQIAEIFYAQSQPKFLRAIAEEMMNFSQSAAQVRATHGLGDRPLIVLTAGSLMAEGALPPGITQTELDEFHQIWVNDLQVREAHLSTRGKQILVPDSTHMIPMERPDAIVSAIHEVWFDLVAPVQPTAPH